MRGFVQWTGTALVAATAIAGCGGGNGGSGNNPVITIAKDPVKSGEAQTATGAPSAGVGGVNAAAAGIVPHLDFALTTANAVREVTVGPRFLFKSVRNNSSNAAVDTIAAGQGVLWRWAGGSHSVESTAVPSFASSATSSTAATIHTVTFPVAGTFQYDCAVHLSGMTGRIVVP